MHEDYKVWKFKNVTIRDDTRHKMSLGYSDGKYDILEVVKSFREYARKGVLREKH